MCRELFQRSALFREHFVKDLELIYKLTAEINSKDKLPPPKPSAQNLKVFALKTLVAWVEEFGEVHKKLKIAYNYFKNCKQVNFETFAVTNSAEQIRQNENELRQRNINEQKLQKVIEDVKSK